MDSQTKTGKVYLQPHKAGKKWKPVWLSLFPPSSSGVGRLEIQDIGGGDFSPGIRRHQQPLGDRKVKVVRLSELISVLRLPPNAEACPGENMSAFCVETQDRTMVFAAPRDECVEWVDKLCLNSFQRGRGGGRGGGGRGGGGRGGGSPSTQLHMEENQIYTSTEEVSEFWVSVQKTDAATRCGLQGSYWLQVAGQSLVLREPQKKNVIREWPYELLRRYGKDQMALSIEAGRRCDSGPGTFTFETQQAEKIFLLIQATIKRKTSSAPLGVQSQEGEKVVVTNIQTHSPEDANMAALLSKHTLASEESAHAQTDQPAPITLMPLPMVPTKEGLSGCHQGGQSDAIYADPDDCIQPLKQPTTALYVDPASVLPLKPPGLREAPPSTQGPQVQDSQVHDSVYSEVYDKIKPPDLQSKRTEDEPIYSEPMNEMHKPAKSEKKPDPFAHLYARVCKTPQLDRSSPSSSSAPCVTRAVNTTEAADETLDDVIYENLGII